VPIGQPGREGLIRMPNERMLMLPGAMRAVASRFRKAAGVAAGAVRVG
jgi:hypothetical protein